MTIAWVGPLPPERSGIADYSAELIPALGSHCELEIFTASPSRAPRELADAHSIHPYRRLPRRARGGRYEAILYQLGNSAVFHRQAYDLALRLPGVVVLHEYVLHHLVKEVALKRGGLDAFAEEMRYCYGRLGLAMARRLLAWEAPPDAWTFPLFERVVDRSLGVICHSEATRRRILASRPRAPVAVVPHHLSLAGLTVGSPAERTAFRRALGIDPQALVVGSFGFVTPPKRLEVALAAFGRLRARRPEAVFLLVGEISPGYPEIHELLADEAGRGVIATGRLSHEHLLAAMAVTDVAVNLRHPTGGETSGVCVRLLGLGVPVLVTDSGWFAEIPDGCAAKVEPGPTEEELVLGYLERLADDRELRRAMGAAAQRWAAAHHDLELSARGYAGALARAAGAQHPAPAVPPLAPAAPGDMAAALAGELGAAVAELGLGEGAGDQGEVEGEGHGGEGAEAELLRCLAEAVVELDLDRAGRPRRRSWPWSRRR